MNTKQKKTLLGAIVALILVGTIVVVGLALAGKFSSTPNDDEAIKKVLKAIEDALAKKEEGNAVYAGGVYIKVQEQWLDANDKKTKKTGDDDRKKMALKEVTVYGAKKEAQNTVGALAARLALPEEKEAAEDKKHVVVVEKAVKFTAEPIAFVADFAADKQYPLITELLKKFKADGDKSVPAPVVEDGDSKDDMVYYQKIDKKSG